MSKELYQDIHAAICEAELPKATEMVAHRLLGKSHPDNGQINMTWEMLMRITGCRNINAARRHLTRLVQAKLIHYSTNDHVFITWLAWMVLGVDFDVSSRGGDGEETSKEGDVGGVQGGPEGSPGDDFESDLFGDTDAPNRRADDGVSARGRAELKHRMSASTRRSSTESARRNTESVSPRAESARRGQNYSHARLFVSLSDPTTHAVSKKTNRQTDQNGAPKLHAPKIAKEEQAKSVALLMDAEVGLNIGMAWRLAASKRFEELLGHVMTWRRQLANGMVVSSGALVHRVLEGWSGQISDLDRQSALYLRHVQEREQRVIYSAQWAALTS
jgi:hypothetical protein